MTRGLQTLTKALTSALAGLALLGILGLVPLTPAAAQTAPAATAAETDAAVDIAQWERIASNTEGLIARPETLSETLEERRAAIADWRERFLAAQGTNATRIVTLRAQIEALGPVPAEGASEDEALAARRKDLAEQLVRLQAPGIAAVEAYSRADGLIREIDRILRERQADELLRL